jgi:hypothetical protein
MKHSCYHHHNNPEDAKAGFRANLFSYIMVITMLWIICFATGSYKHHLWAIYPTLGWGLGLIGHYAAAFGAQRDKATPSVKESDFI